MTGAGPTTAVAGAGGSIACNLIGKFWGTPGEVNLFVARVLLMLLVTPAVFAAFPT